MAPRDFVDSSIGTMDFGERGRSVRGAGGTGTTVGAPLNTSVQDIEDQVRYTVNIPNDDGGSETQQLTRKQIEQSLGMTDTNPYGLMSGIGRLLGTENVSYPGLMGTPAFGAVKDLMVRRYLAPVDPRTGRVEPGLGVGDPTRYGAVERDPSLRNKGLASFIPGGGFITSLFDRSDLTVPGFPSSQDATAVQEDTAQAVVPPAFTPERQAAFKALQNEVLLGGAPLENPYDENFETTQIPPVIDEPISPPLAPLAPLENPYDEVRKIDEVVDGKGRLLGYVDPVYGPDGVTVVAGGYKLPTGSEVIQNIAAGDAGSATITNRKEQPFVVQSGVGDGSLYDSTDVLSPQNIREVLQLPGRDSTRPYPIDMLSRLGVLNP